MNKQDFINKYRISDAKSIDPSGKSIKGKAFAEAIYEFINGNFRGIAEVETDVTSGESVMICAEYTAFYFKTLLSLLHGRVYLKIRIFEDGDNLKLTISSDEDMPLNFEETSYLIKLARNAGMEIYPDGKEVHLTLRYSNAAIHGVYAISITDGKRILLGKFCEIFF